jgi:hypothetical protein
MCLAYILANPQQGVEQWWGGRHPLGTRGPPVHARARTWINTRQRRTGEIQVTGQERYRYRAGEIQVTGQERYRYRAGEIQVNDRRDTGTGQERYRYRTGEIQVQDRRDTGNRTGEIQVPGRRDTGK